MWNLEREPREVECEKDDEDNEAGQICAGSDGDADEGNVVVNRQERIHCLKGPPRGRERRKEEETKGAQPGRRDIGSKAVFPRARS